MTTNEILKCATRAVAHNVSEKNLDVHMDIGSTQTRSSCCERGISTADDMLLMDTEHVILHGAMPFIRTGINMEDNLQCKIKGPAGTWHLLKGSIAALVPKDAVRLSSCSSKLDQEATFQSIVFNCGLNAVIESIKSGISSDIVNVDLTLSLPPEDLSYARQQAMRDKLLGLYEIDFPRLRRKVTLNITGVEVYAEPVAAAFAYLVAEEPDENQTIVFLDCGGRSKGAVLYKDGALILGAVTTDLGGGENFIQDVAHNISDRLEVNLPDINTVRRALSTGDMYIGNKVYSIADDLNQGKASLAEECVSTITRLLDRCDTHLEEVQRIVCTGRTFTPSIKDGTVTSPSLINFIEDALRFSNVPLTFERYAKPNAIVTGLEYYKMLNQE